MISYKPIIYFLCVPLIFGLILMIAGYNNDGFYSWYLGLIIIAIAVTWVLNHKQMRAAIKRKENGNIL